MLHILSSDRRDLEGHVLRGMFEARKRVFVDLLGWDVPVIDGRYEVDQFDDHHATYLVVTDDAGEHRASARLLPTTRPHILDSFFGALCEGDRAYRRMPVEYSHLTGPHMSQLLTPRAKSHGDLG